jgi:hypothetical protein
MKGNISISAGRFGLALMVVGITGIAVMVALLPPGDTPTVLGFLASFALTVVFGLVIALGAVVKALWNRRRQRRIEEAGWPPAPRLVHLASIAGWFSALAAIGCVSIVPLVVAARVDAKLPSTRGDTLGTSPLRPSSDAFYAEYRRGRIAGGSRGESLAEDDAFYAELTRGRIPAEHFDLVPRSRDAFYAELTRDVRAYVIAREVLMWQLGLVVLPCALSIIVGLGAIVEVARKSHEVGQTIARRWRGRIWGALAAALSGPLISGAYWFVSLMLR